MSAKLSFLPWVRRGLAAQRGVTGGDDVAVALTLNAGRVTLALPLLGPEDVTGLDPQAVTRTWPRAEVFDGEPNYFPLVEFAAPDLPWRFTRGAPDARQRLRPWLCLIVLTDDEIAAWRSASAAQPLAVVTVRAGTPLPDLDEAWAWAHVQYAGESPPASGRELEAALAAQPEHFTARLLCPRRLTPRTSYTAVLVPVFERARRVGVGAERPDAAAVDALAWSSDDASRAALELPVYYQFRFGTGIEGDFETLVRTLTPIVLPETVGTRALDASAPGMGLPPASARPLVLEGALRRARSRGEGSPTPRSEDPSTDAARPPFVAALRAVLNGPDRALEGVVVPRRVAPPLYGQYHAARSSLPTSATPPQWFNELNEDPCARVAAGLGARVVQGQQAALLAGAWAQFAQLPFANDVLRALELGAAATLPRHARDLAPLDLESLLLVTAPVHARLTASPRTIRAVLAHSRIVPGFFDPQWRRLTRPGGPIRRRQMRGQKADSRQSALVRMNKGALVAAAPPGVPGGATTVLTLTRGLQTFSPARAGLPAPGAGANVPLPDALLYAARLLPATAAPRDDSKAWREVATAVQTGELARDRALPARALAEVPTRPGFRVTTPGTARPRAPSGSGGASDSDEAAEFRAAAVALFDRLAGIDAPVASPPVDLEHLRKRILTGLHPAQTFADAAAVQFRRGPRTWTGETPVSPVMAYPEFPEPMYRALRALSQDWLLPGLETVPPNAVALLETNWRFVEAYFVGLNFEMARALRWAEFPTDERGTYFQHFWDRSGLASASGTPAADIAPLHTWQTHASLGAARFDRRSDAAALAPPEQLVMLLRTDLLRRYPATTIFAAPAAAGAAPRFDAAGGRRDPVFVGSLPPDVTFLGFDLSLAEVLAPPDPGDPLSTWYFVLQEPLVGSRFGLDADGPPRPRRRGDLAWNQMDVPPGGYVRLASPTPQLEALYAAEGTAARWHVGEGATAAHLAWWTWQAPVQIAIPAAEWLAGL